LGPAVPACAPDCPRPIAMARIAPPCPIAQPNGQSGIRRALYFSRDTTRDVFPVDEQTAKAADCPDDGDEALGALPESDQDYPANESNDSESKEQELAARLQTPPMGRLLLGELHNSVSAVGQCIVITSQNIWGWQRAAERESHLQCDLLDYGWVNPALLRESRKIGGRNFAATRVGVLLILGQLCPGSKRRCWP